VLLVLDDRLEVLEVEDDDLRLDPDEQLHKVTLEVVLDMDLLEVTDRQQ